jgi:hypothetical protein
VLTYSAMIASDPGTYVPLVAPRAREERREALRLGPENPRVILVDGLMMAWAPPSAGIPRSRAYARMEEGLAKFAALPARDPLLPDWGQPEGHSWMAYMLLMSETPDFERARAAARRCLDLRPDFAWVARVLVPMIEERARAGAGTAPQGS